MAQRVKATVAKPDNLSSISRTHRVEEKQLLSVSNSTCKLWDAPTHHTCTHMVRGEKGEEFLSHTLKGRANDKMHTQC